MTDIYNWLVNENRTNNIGNYFYVKDLVTVLTGKEDANFASQNGRYKFFTCSENVLLCDTYKYDNSSILIAGNGSFNVKHYSGKFNAYQRTYILTPDKKYYSALYLSCLNEIKNLRTKASGSIVKFITKEIVDNIKVFIPNSITILDNLNNMMVLKELNTNENDKLLKLKQILLPLLMNGQATID
ncbi:restriction endonuclease subunit S [Mycoplasma yeatsii]|uniref:restriction endonuclease subunit S n=1 Tax=Mycoplasma yeatsii TaxID=51365 RepID=UPI0003A980D0|nr:restriction endonuclease subunit S [Mycoplasma yeatsii]